MCSSTPRPIPESQWIEAICLTERIDAFWARRRAAAAAEELGMSARSIWSISIAVSELAGNALKFANGGRVYLYQIHTPKPGLRIVVEDDGPGIENIENALEDRFSEGRFIQETNGSIKLRGLGAGLGAVQRFMDTFTIENRKEGGLIVVVEKFL